MQEPTDYLILLLLPTILARPQFVAYRTVMLTALWCWYSTDYFPWSNVPGVPSFPVDLVEWLRFTLFGRHATAYEVHTWCARCHHWLSAEGVGLDRQPVSAGISAPSSNADNGEPLLTLFSIAVVDYDS